MDLKGAEGAGPAGDPWGGVWAEFGHGRLGGEDRAAEGEVKHPGIFACTATALPGDTRSVPP